MCLAPKIPKVEVNDPAPPPPVAENSAAYTQGSPELLITRNTKRSGTSSLRNRLKIKPKSSEQSKSKGYTNIAIP